MARCSKRTLMVQDVTIINSHRVFRSATPKPKPASSTRPQQPPMEDHHARPAFRDTHDALTFAFNHSTQQYALSPMA